MSLKLADVKGRNYFSIYSQKAMSDLERIAGQARHGKTDERELRKKLGELIGWRHAKGLGRSQIAEAAEHEREKLAENRAFLKGLRESSVRAAASSVRREFPDFDPYKESELDGVVNAVALSGISAASRLFGHYKTDEALARDIAGGKKLEEIVPARLTKDVVTMLVLSLMHSYNAIALTENLRRMGHYDGYVNKVREALLGGDYSSSEFLGLMGESTPSSPLAQFAVGRKRFEKKRRRLFRENGIGDEFRKYLLDELRTRHRSIGEAQLPEVVRMLAEILEGKPVSGTQADPHLLKYLPLGKMALENIKTPEIDIVPVRTRLLTLTRNLMNQLKGNSSMSQQFLNYLAGLTGIDPYDKLYKWSTGNDMAIVHPLPEIGDAALGRIYGRMSAMAHKASGRWRYTLRGEDAESALYDMIDFGDLTRLPAVTPVEEHPHPEFGAGCSASGTVRISLPSQLGNVYETLDREYDRGDFAREATRAYFDRRGRNLGDGSYRVIFHEGAPERRLRRLAQLSGVEISEGGRYGHHNFRTCSARKLQNPGMA